jgi:hypothetical protein
MQMPNSLFRVLLGALANLGLFSEAQTHLTLNPLRLFKLDLNSVLQVVVLLIFETQ